MGREGYARLCIEVRLEHKWGNTVFVRVWLLEPFCETPKDLKRKWKERDWERRVEPSWFVYSGKVKLTYTEGRGWCSS